VEAMPRIITSNMLLISSHICRIMGTMTSIIHEYQAMMTKWSHTSSNTNLKVITPSSNIKTMMSQKCQIMTKKRRKPGGCLLKRRNRKKTRKERGEPAKKISHQVKAIKDRVIWDTTTREAISVEEAKPRIKT